VFFKFHLLVGVGVLIVNALYGLRITDQLFKSYVFTRVEWCVHNRLSNAYYEVKLKKTPDIILSAILTSKQSFRVIVNHVTSQRPNSYPRRRTRASPTGRRKRHRNLNSFVQNTSQGPSGRKHLSHEEVDRFRVCISSNRIFMD
jgi:hypothetical protein